MLVEINLPQLHNNATWDDAVFVHIRYNCAVILFPVSQSPIFSGVDNSDYLAKSSTIVTEPSG